MQKPIYKYATIWGILGGTALAYIYLLTIGKNKKLPLEKTLLIGGGIGLGLGLGIDLSKPKTPITEDELKKIASELSDDTQNELESYLVAIKNNDISDDRKQRMFNLLKAFLSASKNNKWDNKGVIDVKKQVLISYGVPKSDVESFEKILKENLSISVSKIINEQDKK
jgi:hypothetical protein